MKTHGSLQALTMASLPALVRKTQKRRVAAVRAGVLMMAVGLMLTLSLSAGAQSSVATLSLEGTQVGLGGTTEIPVRLTSSGTAPTSLLVFITYETDKLVPHDDFWEVTEVDALGYPVIDDAGNTNSISTPVRLADELQRDGKTTDSTIYPEGVLGVVISGADDTPIEDGLLMVVAFRTVEDALPNEVSDVAGVPTDAPIALDGEQVASSAASGTAESIDVAFDNTVRITLLDCDPADAPGALTVTDQRPGGVLITWDAVEELGALYRVFRGEDGNSDNAIPLGDGWSPATSYVDITAAAPTVDLSGGCSKKGGTLVSNYYYWLQMKSLTGCDSPLGSRSGTGARDEAPEVSRSASASMDVFPAKTLMGSVQLLQPTGQLALRLEANQNIDPATVWGEVTGETVVDTVVAWIPGLDADSEAEAARSGWVVYNAAATWPAYEVVTLTVGAKTTSGREVGPVSQQFMRDSKPDPGDNSAGAGRLVGLGDGDVTTLAEGLGSVFRIVPRGVYETHQEVRFPVPPGEDVDSLQLYFYCEARGDGRWYVGSQVADWLDPVREETTEGSTYLVYRVRHSGIVQLGRPVGRTEKMALASMAPVIEQDGGNLAVFAALAGVLFVLGVGLRGFRGAARKQIL